MKSGLITIIMPIKHTIVSSRWVFWSGFYFTKLLLYKQTFK